MRKNAPISIQAIFAGLVIGATGVIMLAGIYNLTIPKQQAGPIANLRIIPEEQIISQEEQLLVRLAVESSVPVNVFSGELQFNQEILEVVSIDYNVSVADLWVETPWYSNGEGTINFGGGTTIPGGFVGKADLLTVTFKAKEAGEGTIALKEPLILQYDGLGTPAELSDPIDTIITVRSTEAPNLAARNASDIRFLVTSTIPNTDFNGDGRQTLADTSILVLHLGSDNIRYDLNHDGRVNLDDVNILLNNQ